MSPMKGRIYHRHQCDEDGFAIRMMKRSLLSYSVYFVTYVPPQVDSPHDNVTC